MRSVYIHIPFCNSICSYCDFCKMIYNASWADNYLNELKNEIGKYYENDEIRTIYIGGGTPSSLNILQLKKLFEIINNLFKLDYLEEFTFEINVNDITSELCDILKNNKVNRVSVGVESFDNYNLKFLNRKHDKKMIFNNISLLKSYGFNVNVDLIYALPTESFSTFKSDMSNILKLGVNHISTYSLIIEDNTVLKQNNISNIDEETDYKMYEYICKKLKDYGYNHYEVSNFSKVGFESIHNLTYWNNDEYYGFGLGASGYINGVRYENTRSLNKYINHEYRLNEVIVSKKEDMENELILGLRKLSGINIYHFYEKFNENIQDVFDLKDVVKEELLKLEGNYLMIPEDKIYIMNEIINNIIK